MFMSDDLFGTLRDTHETEEKMRRESLELPLIRK